MYTTTDPQEALQLGGYTHVFHEGRLLQSGPTLDVFRRPATLEVARAFSDPPLNLIPSETLFRGPARRHRGPRHFAAHQLALTSKGDPRVLPHRRGSARRNQWFGNIRAHFGSGTRPSSRNCRGYINSSWVRPARSTSRPRICCASPRTAHCCAPRKSDAWPVSSSSRSRTPTIVRRPSGPLKPLDNDVGARRRVRPARAVGCGKTTLLNIMSGLLRPTHGRVVFDDVDVTSLPPEARNIAQVFQFPIVYETMTVFENLAFPLRNRGWSSPRHSQASPRSG